LKLQVQKLQTELMQIRGGNLNFDFTVKNTTSLTNNTTARNPFQQQNGQQSGLQSSPSPSNGSLTDSSIFRSGQSSLATSPENDVNKNATPKLDIQFELFSNNPAGPVNFTNNSNHVSPLFSTDLFGNSLASNNTTSASMFGQNQHQNTSPILDTFATTLASLTQGQSPQSLTNAFINTMSSSTSTAPLSSFTPSSTFNFFDTNDPLFNTWRDNSISSNGDESGFDIFDTMFSSMSPGAFNLVDTTGLNDFIADAPIIIPQQQNQNFTATGEPAISCPELLAQIQNHPKFDDIDIDQLCAEMRSKAKVCALSKSVHFIKLAHDGLHQT
jgi:hypothetical protein